VRKYFTEQERKIKDRYKFMKSPKNKFPLCIGKMLFGDECLTIQQLKEMIIEVDMKEVDESYEGRSKMVKVIDKEKIPRSCRICPQFNGVRWVLSRYIPIPKEVLKRIENEL